MALKIISALKSDVVFGFLAGMLYVMLGMLLLLGAMAYGQTLEEDKARAEGKPRHCCIVMIRARYEDGRHVSKGETRCLDDSWHAWREQGYEEEPIADMLGQIWIRQDSWGGTPWVTFEPFTDTCEARDGKGKVGSATIKWTKGNHTQYIIVR